MGYESKIYFVQRYDFQEPIRHSHIVAMIDMCKMGYSESVTDFRRCFDTDTDFSVYMGTISEDGREIMEDVIEDAYGEHLKYAKNKDALYESIKQVCKKESFWKFKILKKMIKSFKDCDDIYIVHYGY